MAAALAELGRFIPVVVVSCSLRCCEIGEANRVIDVGCANALHIAVAIYILLTLLCLRLSSSLQAHFSFLHVHGLGSCALAAVWLHTRKID